MKSCKEIMKLVSDGMDKKLPLTERLALNLHLKLCGACREAADMVKTIHRCADKCRESEDQLAPSECLSEESRTRIILELERESEK